jgi:hypothetical protein
MTQHIRSYEQFKKEHHKNNCASFIIFDEFGIENVKIEIVETLENVTDEELLKREIFYINNFKCVNLRNNTLKIQNIKIKNTKLIFNVELINNVIKSLGFGDIDNKIFITSEQLRNNFNIICKTNESIKYKFVEQTTSNKKILGYLNTLFKVINIKITTKQKRMENSIRKHLYCIKIIQMT